METAIIYAMSELLGHNAISLNAILANRNLEEYSVKPENTVENLIEYTLLENSLCYIQERCLLLEWRTTFEMS